MNLYDGYQWFLEQERKRKEQMKKNQLSIINHQLQKLLSEVCHWIADWKKYDDVENQLVHRFGIVQSSLWDLRWANNYESEKVAVAQGLLISHILEHEQFEQRNYLSDRLEYFMRQFGNIDWPAYLDYQHWKGQAIL